VELLKRDGQPLGAYARHYYDLLQLAAQAEVIAMLKSAEYLAIKADYDRISCEHFPRQYFPSDDMRFAGSDALFPPAALAAQNWPRVRGTVLLALLWTVSLLERGPGQTDCHSRTALIRRV
jgi:hypothetical protein